MLNRKITFCENRYSQKKINSTGTLPSLTKIACAAALQLIFFTPVPTLFTRWCLLTFSNIAMLEKKEPLAELTYFIVVKAKSLLRNFELFFQVSNSHSVGLFCLGFIIFGVAGIGKAMYGIKYFIVEYFPCCFHIGSKLFYHLL